ncbi:sensor histidine kinase [Cohnella endophytica]|uniref:histidine kinase n=1 Tax=Cohnella endophytica TaxID=2419778 RepID=A0A494Y085_9BACL|nr:HAMP domain-containing sensor histidine kinase [Cohnella endophytica]RKP56176.1 sensor histidine kinase [Cohnella endophytica]
MSAVSIKVKFSLFLAALLSLTVLVLSVYVLRGIKDQQRQHREKELLQQTRIANLSVKQAYLTSPPTEAQLFLRNRGQQFAMDLAVYSGLHVVLYDMTGAKAGDSVPLSGPYDVEQALSYALQGKIAYQQDGQSLLYLTPLQGPDSQMGVIQFRYSLESDMRFYDTIARLFLLTGGIVLTASFILGYLYFRRATSAIVKLNQSAEQIRTGQFLLAAPLKRKDELGQLSRSIFYMSTEIRNNIGAMKEEETKLRQAVDKLQKLEQQQKQFIGNISHEFKTPLTSIKAYAELMDLYSEDANLRADAVHRILEETGRLNEMVERVLRLAALEKYDFEYRPELVDLQSLLRDLTDRMTGKAERFGVTINASLASADIWADRESFIHIFVNLLDNAIKYNVPGGRVDVNCRHDPTGTQAIVEIADTGIGIPDEARINIFEPFFTVNKDRSRVSGGTGLGLALVQRLVEKHRGTIELLTTGTGTTFRLTFPVKPTLPRKEEPL